MGNNKCSLHNEFQITVRENQKPIHSYTVYNRILPEAFEKLRKFEDIYKEVAVYGITDGPIENDGNEDTMLLNKPIEAIEEEWTEQWNLTRRGRIKIEPHELIGKKIRQVGLYADGAMTMAWLKNSEGRNISISKDATMSVEIVVIVYYQFHFEEYVSNHLLPSDTAPRGSVSTFMRDIFGGSTSPECNFNLNEPYYHNYKQSTKTQEGTRGIITVNRIQVDEMNNTLLTRAIMGGIFIDLRKNKAGQIFGNVLVGKGDGTNDTFMIPHRNPSLTEEMAPMLSVYVDGIKQEANAYDVVRRVDYLHPTVLKFAQEGYQNIAFMTNEYYVSKSESRIHYRDKETLRVVNSYPFSDTVGADWLIVYVTEDLSTIVLKHDYTLKHFDLVDGMYTYDANKNIEIDSGKHQRTMFSSNLFTVSTVVQEGKIEVKKYVFNKNSKKYTKAQSFQVFNSESLIESRYAIDVELEKLYYVNDDDYLYSAELSTQGEITAVKLNKLDKYMRFMNSMIQEVSPNLLYNENDSGFSVASTVRSTGLMEETSTNWPFTGRVVELDQDTIFAINKQNGHGTVIRITDGGIEVDDSDFEVFDLTAANKVGQIGYIESSANNVAFYDTYKAMVKFKPGNIPPKNASITARYAVLGIEKTSEQIVEVALEFEYKDGEK